MKIRQYCSVCKAEYDMEVVPAGEGDDDPVVWLRCPSCEGYLPKIRDSKAFQEQAATAGGETAGEETPAAADGDTTRDEAAEPPLPTGEPGPSIGGADAVREETPPEETPAADDAAAEAVAEAAEAERLLAEADLERAIPYRPWQTYEVGDVIHHLAWDDFGVVLAKETLPGHRQVVKVHFGRAGTVRLIENDGSRP